MSDQNPLRRELLQSYQSFSQLFGDMRIIELALEELGLLDDELKLGHSYISNAHSFSGEGPRIELSFFSAWNDKDVAAIHMGECIRKVLPKVGKFEKGFSPDGKITATAKYKHLTIVLCADPPSTCTIRLVEETLEVPEEVIPEKVIPAHTKTITKYVMEGDCEPILKPKEPAEPERVPAFSIPVEEPL